MAVASNFNPAFDARLQRFLEAARAQGIEVSVISGARSSEDQRQLYENYLAGKAGRPLPYPERGAVPLAAPPGSSAHEAGLAADVQAVNSADQPKLWALSQEFGLQPLGPSDRNHFQLAGFHPGEGSSSMQPRGIRNNNPGNLEANDWTSKLPGYVGSDGRFAIFDTAEHGAEALDRNLQSYGSQGINTPRAIAAKWAPPGENNSTAYAGYIARALGVGLDDQVDMANSSVRAKIVPGISMAENGPGYGTTVNTTPPGPVDPSIVARQKIAGITGAPSPPIPADAVPAAAPYTVAAAPPTPSIAERIKSGDYGGALKQFISPTPAATAGGTPSKSPMEALTSGLSSAMGGGQQQAPPPAPPPQPPLDPLMDPSDPTGTKAAAAAQGLSSLALALQKQPRSYGVTLNSMPGIPTPGLFGPMLSPTDVMGNYIYSGDVA